MSKYHAIPTTVDDITFDSRAEARRYEELMLMERAGGIIQLVVHPQWNIVVNEVNVCRYEADFQYTDTDTGKSVVEDVKGVKTPVYRLKKKLMLAVHGIEIVEIPT